MALGEDDVLQGMGRDQPVKIDENGAGQSDIPYRVDLVDADVVMHVARILHEGAEKYGAGNWRDLPIRDHLNHMLAHAFAYLAGDEQDDHLLHAVCRAVFAAACELRGGKLEPER